MLVNQNETRRILRQIVFKVTANRGLHEDLTQEALLHLWLREKQCPGQTQSWYFQSCRFFLQNYLRNGRSVDSTKHCTRLFSPAQSDLCGGASSDESVSGHSVLALVSAREMVWLLAKWLTPLERKVLSCLAEGFGARQIA